jgi:hypothetical protein
VRASSFLYLLLTLLSISADSQGQSADFDNSFAKADSLASLYATHSLKDLKRLSDKLTTPFTTQEEKFRAIYTWVCSNIKNDYRLYLSIKKKREKFKDSPEELIEWNKKISRLVFSRLVNEQKTICTGYAYLIKELATCAGLSCVIVNGYGRTAQSNIGGEGVANHSWNAVLLNKKWYLCDATWSSGIIDSQTAEFIKKINFDYFLPDPSLFIRTHYPIDPAWMLLPDSARFTLQDFLNGPLVYSNALRCNTNPLSPETFDVSTVKGTPAHFRFRTEDKTDIRKVELKVIGHGSVASVFPAICSEGEGVYSFETIFKTKGKYVVHILYDESYTFTYDVIVK